MAFLTTNTLGNLRSLKNHTTDKFSRSGVYRLTCQDCYKAYMGQTGIQFSVRYKEHQTSFSKNNNSSNFAKHLKEEGHSFGPIHNIMEIHYQGKGNHLNTVERFYIYAKFAANNQLNDAQTHSPNAIFDIQRPTDRNKTQPSSAPHPNSREQCSQRSLSSEQTCKMITSHNLTQPQ
jgi:hypothetical protein